MPQSGLRWPKYAGMYYAKDTMMTSLPQRLRAQGLETTLLVISAAFLFVLPIPHTATLRLAFLFVAVMLSVALIRRHGTPMLPLKGPFLAWALVAGLSLVYAVKPEYSLGEIKTELLYSFFAFFVFFTQTRGSREWNVCLSAIVMSLLTLSATNVWLWYTTADAMSPRYFYNGVGAYTTYVVTVLPFVILFLFKMPVRGFGRLLLRSSPLLLLVPAYVTMNRTVWIVGAVLMLTLVPLLVVGSKSRISKLIATGALAAFFAASLFFFYSSLERRSIQGEPEAVIDVTLAADPRPALWSFVIAKIASHPLRGVGFGQQSFGYAYHQWPEKNGLLTHTHNVFLDAGIQMGVPGIAAMIFIFAAILFEYWRLYRSDSRVAQWLGACGIAMVIAVVTRNLTDDFFRRDLALLFWSLVGASLGYGQRLLDPEFQRSSAKSVPTKMSASGLISRPPI